MVGLNTFNLSTSSSKEEVLLLLSFMGFPTTHVATVRVYQWQHGRGHGRVVAILTFEESRLALRFLRGKAALLRHMPTVSMRLYERPDPRPGRTAEEVLALLSARRASAAPPASAAPAPAPTSPTAAQENEPPPPPTAPEEGDAMESSPSRGTRRSRPAEDLLGASPQSVQEGTRRRLSPTPGQAALQPPPALKM